MVGKGRQSKFVMPFSTSDSLVGLLLYFLIIFFLYLHITNGLAFGYSKKAKKKQNIF